MSAKIEQEIQIEIQNEIHRRMGGMMHENAATGIHLRAMAAKLVEAEARIAELEALVKASHSNVEAGLPQSPS